MLHYQICFSVDSQIGLSLLSVRQGLFAARDKSPLSSRSLEGLRDAFNVLVEEIELLSEKKFTAKMMRRSLQEILFVSKRADELLLRYESAALTPQLFELILSGLSHHIVEIKNRLEEIRMEHATALLDGVLATAQHVDQLADRSNRLV